MGHMQEWAGGPGGVGRALTHVLGHLQAFKSRCRSLLQFVKGSGVGALEGRQSGGHTKAMANVESDSKTDHASTLLLL